MASLASDLVTTNKGKYWLGSEVGTSKQTKKSVLYQCVSQRDLMW